MFGCRNDTIFLQALHVCQSFEHDVFFILSERSHSNYRIVRVGIYIDDRCKIHRNANTLAFICNDRTHLINQFIVLNGTKAHLEWKNSGTIQSHAQTPFSINTY